MMNTSQRSSLQTKYPDYTPIQAGQIVCEQHKSRRRGVRRRGDDDVEARQREEEAEDR